MNIFDVQMVASASNNKDIDALLVREIRERHDRAAFAQLVNKYQSTVFGFCYRYTGNSRDAEDIAQDIFIKVFRHIGNFRGESKFSTWLYSIMANTCASHARWVRNKRIREMETWHPVDKEGTSLSHDVPDQSGDPEKKLLNKELGSVIQQIIARLKDRQRSVVIMKDFQGKTYEEIASVMNMNLGTVRSTLSRGRLAIAKQMKEYLMT